LSQSRGKHTRNISNRLRSAYNPGKPDSMTDKTIQIFSQDQDQQFRTVLSPSTQYKMGMFGFANMQPMSHNSIRTSMERTNVIQDEPALSKKDRPTSH